MTLAECPHCQGPLALVESGAIVQCRHCGGSVRMPVAQLKVASAAARYRTKAAREANNPTALVVVLVGLVVAVGVATAWVVDRSSRPSSAAPAAPADPNFHALAREAIRMQLKYPRDASFPMFEQHLQTYRNGRVRVSGIVKAPNGFGAVLSHQYSCLFEADGSLLEVQID